jgi:ubiquinone/menaquinone biosynthesis C-methylase UbiE
MQTNWWENFFHGVALDFWRAAISVEQTRAEADFINNQLQLPVGAKLLDVPCGNGRLAIELGAFGFELTGVDIAVEFIEEAKSKAEARGVNVDWRNIEMRALPWTGEFDGAFCFGNSFGYFNDDENTDFLKVVTRTLKPGARFILDAPAIAECLLPHFLGQRTIELGDIACTIDTRYDHEQSRMFPSFTFVRNGVEDQRSSSQRIYTYRELVALLSEAGLETVAAYSSLTEEPFQLGAHRLLLVTKKP